MECCIDSECCIVRWHEVLYSVLTWNAVLIVSVVLSVGMKYCTLS